MPIAEPDTELTPTLSFVVKTPVELSLLAIEISSVCSALT